MYLQHSGDDYGDDELHRDWIFQVTKVPMYPRWQCHHSFTLWPLGITYQWGSQVYTLISNTPSSIKKKLLNTLDSLTHWKHPLLSIFVFTNIIGLSCSFGIYSLFNIQTKDKANLILTTHAFCLTERIGVQLIIAIWGEKRRERYGRWSVLSQIHLENARLKMLSTFSTVRASQSLCYGNAPFGGARACIHCPPHLFDSSSLRVIYIFSLQVYMYWPYSAE